MKTLLTLLWASYVFCSTAMSQTMDGTYSNTWENTDGAALTYTLILKPNGTFLFESYRVYQDADLSKTVAINGTWQQEGRLLTLNTVATAGDEVLAANLNSTQARFESYSPRHIQYGKIKPSLSFYQSEVFYAKGMKLEKESVEIVASTTESKDMTVVANDDNDG